MYETADPSDNLHVEYGALAESVDYLQHNSRISPFRKAYARWRQNGTVDRFV